VKRSLEILHDFFQKPETVRVWLNTPHPDLDGRTALEMILANNTMAVLRILEMRRLACLSDAASASTGHRACHRNSRSAHGPWSRAVGYRYLLGPLPGWPAATTLVGWRRQNHRRPLHTSGQFRFHLPRA